MPRWRREWQRACLRRDAGNVQPSQRASAWRRIFIYHGQTPADQAADASIAPAISMLAIDLNGQNRAIGERVGTVYA
jgi:hypothetical protein